MSHLFAGLMTSGATVANSQHNKRNLLIVSVYAARNFALLSTKRLLLLTCVNCKRLILQRLLHLEVAMSLLMQLIMQASYKAACAGDQRSCSML